MDDDVDDEMSNGAESVCLEEHHCALISWRWGPCKCVELDLETRRSSKRVRSVFLHLGQSTMAVPALSTNAWEDFQLTTTRSMVAMSVHKSASGSDCCLFCVFSLAQETFISFGSIVCLVCGNDGLSFSFCEWSELGGNKFDRQNRSTLR